MIRIKHRFNECIGCAQCVEHAPDYWVLDADGIAQLWQATHHSGGVAFGQAFEPDRATLVLAEKSCPVNIIELA